MTRLEECLGAVVVLGVAIGMGALAAKVYLLVRGDQVREERVAERVEEPIVAKKAAKAVESVLPQVFVCPVHGDVKQAMTVKQPGKPTEEYCFQCYVESIRKTCQRVSKKP